MEQNRHFTAIVVGNNPDSIIAQYNKAIKVEPYLLYQLSKKKEYHESMIHFYEKAIESTTDEKQLRVFKEELDYLKSIDDLDYYYDITDGLDINKETGDAYSTENPNGKYDQCNIGKFLSMPLITKDNKEVYSTTVGNVNWNAVHLSNRDIYKRTWEMVVDGDEPKNDDEKTIFDNMRNATNYFKYFGDKETYVAMSTAFWGYAYVDQNGWIEMDGKQSQKEWVLNFYERFIKKLPQDTIISVYECFRK